jgi:CubicO group peptidase (beta-lactamase class C family)
MKTGNFTAVSVVLAFAAATAVGGCTSSYSGRWLVWNWSGIEDHLRFPGRPVAPAGTPFHFAVAAPVLRVAVERNGALRVMGLDELGHSTSSTALIVIHRDTILFEGYFNGHDRSSINTSFSVAKSITSLLIGIAIDQGLIRSVDDPVTDYLPELAERDARFGRLTLAHLLDMRSGLRWRDHDFITGDKPRAYYHPHLRRLVLEELGFSDEPGQRWVYNSYNPILLGLVLERSTGRAVSEFLTERVWRRIGTEFPASWSTDGKRDPMEKMESGVNARAIDFAKLGRLVLAGGSWEGERVVSREWIEASTRAELGCGLAIYRPRVVCYQRAWWLYPDEGGRAGAVGATGHLGQYIVVFPERELVIVRFGWKQGGVHWPTVFQGIARAVEGGHHAF